MMKKLKQQQKVLLISLRKVISQKISQQNKYPAGQNQEFAPGDAAIVICGSWLPNEAKDSVADGS